MLTKVSLEKELLLNAISGPANCLVCRFKGVALKRVFTVVLVCENPSLSCFVVLNMLSCGFWVFLGLLPLDL